jgi:L-threonylcarbamoyladenylate synthase
MKLLSVDPIHPDPAPIRAAADVLRAGGLVAFPTETVYGLGADALSPAAVARIYEAKGRPSYNPLIVHAADAEAARALAARWPAEAELLAAAFWPGPLTLILPRAASIPAAVTAGLPDVALRVPAHPVARALLAAAGIPVAAPSANRSTELSPTTAEHVVRSLGERVDVVVDGGPCAVGIESTVITLSSAVPTILRPGSVSADQLRAVIGEVAAGGAKAGGALPSPGMMDRHYAPRATLRVFDEGTVPSGRTAVLVIDAERHPEGDVVRMPPDAAAYAARLYAALHEMDDLGYDTVLVQQVPDGPEWAGVRDRLRRAAHPG